MILEEYSNLKNNYKKCFLEELEKLAFEMDKLKPSTITGDIIDNYSKKSEGKIWQNQVLSYLENCLQKDIKKSIENVEGEKLNYSCAKCGVCCKFACSQFSPKDLENKANNGDITAKEFLKTFVPYENNEIPQKIYPQYLEFVEDNSDKEYYVYHCPRVTEENTCSCYDERPQICRNFPDSPIEFLPKSCAYTQWKKDMEEISLRLKAKSEIYNFYIEKLKGLQ